MINDIFGKQQRIIERKKLIFPEVNILRHISYRHTCFYYYK